MRLSAALVRTACKLLVGVLLFAQLAIAAHACEGPAAMRAAEIPMRAAADAMPADCDAAMPQGSGKNALCGEHCRSGDQSTDIASLPALAAIPVFLYAMPRLDLTDGADLRSGASPTSAAIPPPPPHAIAHCVWRI